MPNAPSARDRLTDLSKSIGRSVVLADLADQALLGAMLSHCHDRAKVELAALDDANPAIRP